VHCGNGGASTDKCRRHLDVKDYRDDDRIDPSEEGGEARSRRSMRRFAGANGCHGDGGIEHVAAHRRPSRRSATAEKLWSPPCSATIPRPPGAQVDPAELARVAGDVIDEAEAVLGVVDGESVGAGVVRTASASIASTSASAESSRCGKSR